MVITAVLIDELYQLKLFEIGSGVNESHDNILSLEIFKFRVTSPSKTANIKRVIGSAAVNANLRESPFHHMQDTLSDCSLCIRPVFLTPKMVPFNI